MTAATHTEQAGSPPGAPPLDPELAEALAALPPWVTEPIRVEDVEELRSRFDALMGPQDSSPAVETTEHHLSGSALVPVAVHRPRGRSGPLPCVYWIHGGGFMLGSHRHDDAMLRGWCEEFGCVTMSVGYRLAPEHPFPAALEDCFAGLLWAHEAAPSLGIDSTRIGIAGGSAGGALAAALTLLVRDRGGPAPSFQLLGEPVLDDRMVTISSGWSDARTWNPASNETGWRAYLGPLFGGDVPAHAAPARESDLRGLPRTYVVVGGADILFDEAVDYATRLGHAGVSVDLRTYAGAPHGFRNLAPGSALARRATQHQTEWLTAMLT